MADRWVASLLIGLVNGAVGLAWALVFGVPAAAAWPYLGVSALLQTGYLLLLTRTYAHGDMSRLYPVARGTSPVVVTVIAIAVLHERVSALSLVGMSVLVAAIGLLA